MADSSCAAVTETQGSYRIQIPDANVTVIIYFFGATVMLYLFIFKKTSTKKPKKLN